MSNRNKLKMGIKLRFSNYREVEKQMQEFRSPSCSNYRRKTYDVIHKTGSTTEKNVKITFFKL